jgi:hypothetical protein
MKRALLCTLLMSGAVGAAELPVSLQALLQRVPDLPASAQEAARWTDGPGRIVEPRLVALKSDLAAHQRWVEKLAAPLAQSARQQGQAQVEDIGKGLADAGIDMQRMQRDPAYAQQVQARMRSMSPQQLMALSQQMSRPMNQDSRLTNEAAVQASESPAVREAAAVGAAYSSEQTARWQTSLASWQRADEAVARINARKLKVSAPKPAIEFDNIGCNSACQGQWHAYAAQMLPLMIARETEILQVRAAALRDLRAAMAPGIGRADSLLTAAGYGATARSSLFRQQIGGYDASVVGDLQLFITRIEESTEQAAHVVRCGERAVLVPLAVCD